MEALVISNKQEIKPTLKSERKTTAITTDLLANNENRRPPTSHFKGQPASSSYQKIKRTIGSNQECELIYEKEILSQLIKGSLSKAPPKDTPSLSSMLNFFTKSGGSETKRKVSTKLGLDKLLSWSFKIAVFLLCDCNWAEKLFVSWLSMNMFHFWLRSLSDLIGFRSVLILLLLIAVAMLTLNKQTQQYSFALPDCHNKLN